MKLVRSVLREPKVKCINSVRGVSAPVCSQMKAPLPNSLRSPTGLVPNEARHDVIANVCDIISDASNHWLLWWEHKRIKHARIVTEW